MPAWLMALALIVWTAALGSGCNGPAEPDAQVTPSSDSPGTGPAAPSSGSDSSPADAASSVETSDSNRVAEGLGEAILPVSDLWDLLTIGGQRIGHGHTTIRHEQHDGRPAMRIRGVVRMGVRRFGERTEQEIRFDCLETPDGRLLEFQSSVAQGAVPMRTLGRVDGERLTLTVGTAGRTEEKTVPWSPDYGAFFGVEQSLWRRPMKPGEERTIEALELGLHAVATHRLTARRFEPVDLPSGRFDLLRIDHQTRLGPGAELGGILWADAEGRVLKTQVASMGLESYRVTRAVALGEGENGEPDGPEVAELDLGWDVAVPLDRPLPRPHRNARVRYRATLDDGDPAEVFPRGPSQQVARLDDRTAELTVWALRLGVDGNPADDLPADEPTDADRRPSSIIQSDDPTIIKLAGKAMGGADSPWSKAVAAERFVHEFMTEKGFSQAFATAAEVAASREGDCSEHSVLLIGLLRAAGIPARAVAGLVYNEDGQAFYYHMWVEVHVDGRWIPLDATLGQGGIGGGHLKLADSSLDSAASFTAFLPVVRVLGRLNVELIEADEGE